MATLDDLNGRPSYKGNPFYGYNAPQVQVGYETTDLDSVASFFTPMLRPGMSLLDCGCGPGSLTIGLAKIVDPAIATGIDLEPSMVTKAIQLSDRENVINVDFRAADMRDLPFADNSFDAVFSSAVLEHLSDPVVALSEAYRVVKKGGLIGVLSTDWTDPLISPENEFLKSFFELFEQGFNRTGGSLNRGRYLRLMLEKAGFDVVEFSAGYINSATPESTRGSVDRFINWMDNIPIFQQAVDLKLVENNRLEIMGREMKKWSEKPGAFMATTRCMGVGRKR